MKNAGNLYATTISVLVSAVQKIARAMKLPEGLRLFRGLGKLMDLPKEFFTADAQGCKGFVEWGFMSTTSDEQVGGMRSRREGGREGAVHVHVLCTRTSSQARARASSSVRAVHALSCS